MPASTTSRRVRHTRRRSSRQTVIASARGRRPAGSRARASPRRAVTASSCGSSRSAASWSPTSTVSSPGSPSYTARTHGARQLGQQRVGGREPRRVGAGEAWPAAPRSRPGRRARRARARRCGRTARSTSARSWLDTISVSSPRRLASRSMISTRPAGSSAAAGSSASSRRGSPISPAASPSRARMPREKPPTLRVATSARPTRSSSPWVGPRLPISPAAASSTSVAVSHGSNSGASGQ